MKVLHISTSDQGGAGKAALRLHLALLSAGVDSKFLCLVSSENQQPEVYRFKERTHQSIFRRVIRKLGFSEGELKKKQKALNKRGGDYEVFSFPNSKYNLLNNSLVQEADLINLHWVANFMDWSSFLGEVNKPIVWTLHDMNPIQGGFHYTGDVIANQKALGNLDQVITEEKIRAISRVKSLTVVGLTDWLKEASEKSQILGSFPHELIRNSLDLSIFKPFSKSFSREVLGLPANENIFLFVSDSITNKRKGLDLLLEALKLYKAEEPIFPVAVGAIPQKNIDRFKGVSFLGKITDDRLMSLVYSAADVVVIPSREDNLPNVMLEALACGCPVIGFPVGGIREVIINGRNGVLADEVSALSLSVAMETFLKAREDFSRNSIRTMALEEFNPGKQAKKYFQLYSSILRKS